MWARAKGAAAVVVQRAAALPPPPPPPKITRVRCPPGLRLVQRLVRDVHNLLQDGVNVLFAAFTVRRGSTLTLVHRTAHTVMLGHEHARLRRGVHHAPLLVIHTGRHNHFTPPHKHKHSAAAGTAVAARLLRLGATSSTRVSPARVEEEWVGARHTPPSQPRGQQRLTVARLEGSCCRAHRPSTTPESLPLTHVHHFPAHDYHTRLFRFLWLFAQRQEITRGLEWIPQNSTFSEWVCH